MPFCTWCKGQMELNFVPNYAGLLSCHVVLGDVALKFIGYFLLYIYMYVIITAFLCWSSCVGSLSSSRYDLQLVGSQPCYTHSKIIKNMEWRKTGSIPKHVYWEREGERERQKRGIIVCKFNISYNIFLTKLWGKKGSFCEGSLVGGGGGWILQRLKTKFMLSFLPLLCFPEYAAFRVSLCVLVS